MMDGAAEELKINLINDSNYKTAKTFLIYGAEKQVQILSKPRTHTRRHQRLDKTLLTAQTQRTAENFM